MTNRITKFRQLFILAMLLNILSQGIHESGHWAIYQAYDRGPVWGFIGLVQLSDTPPLHPDGWVPISSSDGSQSWFRLASAAVTKTEKALEAAGGPLASLLGAVMCLVLAYRSKNTPIKQMALMLALLISLVMALYYLRSPMRTGGDEIELAALLGVSRGWIEIPFAVTFVVCLIVGLRLLANWRERGKWLGAALIGSMVTGLLVNQVDGLVRSQVNLGNPIFQPVLGVSLPVLVTYFVVVLLLAMFWLILSRSQISENKI